MYRRVALLSILLLSAEAAWAEIRLDFEGFPEEISGPPGATRHFTAFATLTCAAGDAASASWSLSMTADGGLITDISIDGLTVLTSGGETRVTNNFFSIRCPYQHQLPGACEAVHANDPDRHGAYSIVLALNYPGGTPELLPDVVHRLARITVEVTLPPPGEMRQVTLRYEDGFCDSTGCFDEGVSNGIYDHGQFQPPDTTVPRVISLRGGGGFRRGYTNDDNDLDVSDAIFALNYLFLGSAAPHCHSSLDVNDDATINIADPVYLILYLFYDGAPPLGPFDECGHDPTPDELGCESSAPCP